MRFGRVATLGALAGLASPVAAAVVTPGNLIVLQVTEPSGTLSTNAAALMLKEFAPAGGPAVQTYSLPSTGPGAITIGGTAVTEGHLTYNDGFLALAGFRADAGTPAVVASSTAGDAPVLRRAAGFHVAADLAAGPQIGATTTAFSGGNARGALVSGNHFYMTGGGTFAPGVNANGPVYLSAGSDAAPGTLISNDLGTTRSLAIVDGNLYISAQPSARGIYRYTGIPTETATHTSSTDPLTIRTPQTDNVGNVGQVLGDFWVSPDLSVAYVADDSTAGGLKKYLKGATGYTFAYQISTDYDSDGPAASAAHHFTVDTSGPNPKFYVTSGDRTRILTVSDMGDAASANATLATLLTADANTWFRGVTLLPSLVPGDADGDGAVDADDYVRLDRGYARYLDGSLPAGTAAWTDGDFNNDGVLDSRDYLLIDTTWAMSNPLEPGFLAKRSTEFGDAYVASLLVSVPEPATPAVLGFVGTGFVALRRRRAQSCSLPAMAGAVGPDAAAQRVSLETAS